jgi:hypothetical protein
MSDGVVVIESGMDGDVKNVDLHPGDCFGWYSHVSGDCHTTSCLRSEMCRNYTLGRANQAETSIKRDIDDIGKDSSERIKEAQVDPKETKKKMADLGKQAFFDKIVSMAASSIQHDRVKHSPKRDTASLKVGGRVVAFLARKRNEVIFELGGRSKGGPVYTVPFGETLEVIKSQIESFVEEHCE